jgi:HAMP domain-containing protein/putative methionine-R-sulfoxide reductase with GAF domain
MENPKQEILTKAQITPEERQRRNAFFISLVTAVIMAVVSVFLLVYFDIMSVPLASYLIIVVTLIISGCGLLSSWYNRLKLSQIGVYILLGSIYLGSLAMPFILDGQGVQFGIITILLVAGISSIALKGRSATWAILVGVGFAVYNILFDFYGPALAPQGNSILTSSIAAVVVLIYLVIIFRQFPQFSMRTKLIIAFILVSLLPLFVLSAINYQQLSQNRLQETQTTLTTWSRQVAGAVDSFIAEQIAAVYTESQLPDFRDLLGLSPTERSGSEVESKVAETVKLLQRWKSAYVRSYALLDIDGVDIVDSDQLRIGKSEKNQKYFTEAVSTGTSYVSDVFFEPEGPSLYFTSPVRDKSGKIVGMLRVQYNAIILHNTVMSIATKWQVPDLYAVLIDNQYYIRLSQTRDLGLMYKSYDSLDDQAVAQLQSERRLPSGTAQELSTNQPSIVSWLKKLDEQQYFTTTAAALGGADAISTATRLQNVPWIVITSQSLVVANAPAQQQFHLSVIWALVVVLFVSLAALMASQVLTAPIVRLTKVAEQVAKGELATRAQVETADEIGTLAETFNVMTDELSRTLMGLEKRVAERTRGIELSADISRRLSIILDPSQLVTEVVELLQFAFDYYHAQIYLFDEEHENLIMVGGTGEAGRLMLERGHKLARGQGLVGRACETGAVVLVPETQKDSQWVPNQLLPDTKSEIAVPIILGDQVLGALDVQQNKIGGLGQQDSDLLSAVANQVAIALRNARQFAETQLNIAHQTQVSAIIQQIQSTTSVENALQVAAREIGRALNAQRTKAQIVMSQDRDGKN